MAVDMMDRTRERERAIALARARKRAAEQAASREAAPPTDSGPGLLSTSEDGSKRGVLPFVNRGIANVLGAPVDLVNAGLGAVGVPTSETPFGGSASIAGGMQGLGVAVSEADQQPEGLGEYVGRGVGEAAGALVPVLGGARALQASQGPMRAAAGRTIMDPFTRTPGRALTAEAMAGAGMGAGGAAADRLYDSESPAARMTGEILGGVVGGMGPYAVGAGLARAPLTGTAIRYARKTYAPFTEAGAKERARDRVRSLAEDPEEARRLIDEPGIGNLTPAQRTGDERLMALERSVRDTDPAASRELRVRDAEAHQALREAMREPAAGRSVEDARQFIGRRLDDLLRQMDNRVQLAARTAERKIEQLAPEQRASQSAIIVREELDGALAQARKDEARLWSLIPKKEMAPTTASRQAYRRILADTPQAQRDTIPEKARQFLDPDNSNSAFKTQESISELHGLYSAMRQQARHARAADERNTARISDEIADALLVDMGAAAGDTPAGRLINDAREFSNRLNEKFTRGSVGRVLGHAREGGDALPAELTLDTTIGRSGLRGAVSTDDIRRAVGDAPDTDAAMQDYLRSRFRDYTVRNGQFSDRRAQDFLRQNDELLDRFPGLKSQMADAERAQALATSTANRIGRRADALRDPRQSRAAEFLNAPVEQEIQAVLRSRDPGAAALELRRQTAKDTTGDATRGLKGGLVDHLMHQARSGQFDESGQSLLSGRALMASFRDKRTGPVVRALLSTQEQSRLLGIAGELSKLETSRSGQLPSVGPVIDDNPGTLLSLLGRTMAARMGSRAGAGTSGASLLTAHFASKRMQRFLASMTNDRAELLIREAITDPALFRDLLSEKTLRSDAAANRLIETMTALTGGAVASSADEDR